MGYFCMVPGCSSGTRKGLAVSFHLLPRDLERCKQWLRAINHPKFGEDTAMEAVKQQKVCSLHFKPEDFKYNVRGKKRAALLNTAIPCTSPDDEQPSGTSSAKRICLETQTTSAAAVLSSSEEDEEHQSAPTETDKSYQPDSTLTPTSSSSEYEGVKDWREKNIIVNESSLMSRFEFCQMCAKPISSKTIFDSGAQRTVEWMCLGGHSGTWTSSPDIRGMPETAPCEESCPGITFDLSEFTFDEENNCSNKEGGEAGKENNCSNEAGGKAEVEINSSSEEGEEEEENEEKDDRDSDWENQDSDQLESDDSGDSTESDLNSNTELPKKVRQLCPECGAFFFTCKAHTCEYKIKPFSCNVCGKRCVDVNSLKLHSAIHKESYKHLCKFCLAPFKTKLDKHAHEGAHKYSSKPYTCPDCSLTFAKIHARNEHLKGHRGPKRYTCPHCALEFRNANHLERHTMVHTGKKEYVCEFCSRSFNQPGHLKSHLRVHTGEKPFQCQHCDKSFNHNVSLKSHVMRYHKEEASDSGLSGPVKRTKRTIWESTGRPRGRPKRNAATNSIPAVKGEAPDPTTAAETSVKGHLRRDSSEDIDSNWSDKDPSSELREEDKMEESKQMRKSKRKARPRSMTDYIVEKDSESDSDSNPEEEAKKRKVVKSQET